MTVVIAVYAFFYISPKDPENDEPNSTEQEDSEERKNDTVRESNIESSESQTSQHPSMKTMYMTVMVVIMLSSVFNIPRWFELSIVETKVSGTVCYYLFVNDEWCQ